MECALQKRHDNLVRKQQEEDMKKSHAERVANDRKKILEGFTPRELMNELASRGYKGKLTFTQVIDICDF